MANENVVTSDQSTNNSAVPPLSNAERMYPGEVQTELKTETVVEPVKTEPVKTEPVVTEPVKAEPVKTEPVKTEPVKTEPVKTEEPAKTEPEKVEPVKVELKIPESMKAHKVVVDEVLEFAKAHKLSPEQTQVMLDREAAIMDNSVKSQIKTLETQKATWAAAAQADPEIGGEKFAETLTQAQRIYKLAPPSIQKYLEDSGLGSHPDALKWFAKIGKSGLADKLIPAGNESHVENRSAAERMYPNM